MTHEETLERANENAQLREARIEAGRFASPVEAHDPPGVDEWTDEEREEARYALAARRMGIDVTLNSPTRSAFPAVFFRHDRHPPKGSQNHWMADSAREAYEAARADNFGHDWPAKDDACPTCGKPNE